MKKIVLGLLAGLTWAAALPVGAVETGADAPAFSLQDIDGKKRALADAKGSFVVLEWTNHGCPFVKKHYDSGIMQALQKEFTAQGVTWLSICSSGKGKEGHLTPAEWKKVNAEKNGAASAVLLDPSGTVGKLYGAKTTPHMFVINKEGKIIYQGAIDDTPSADPADAAKAKNYVREALNEALAGKAVTVSETKPYGCGVKYK
jgi:peroxiredoxin